MMVKKGVKVFDKDRRDRTFPQNSLLDDSIEDDWMDLNLRNLRNMIGWGGTCQCGL